jgi:arylsulfatase A-like enzyme
MEIYAAFLEHADYHVGRLIDSLSDLEIQDDTLIYYIIGDNGASAEGTLIGSFHEQAVGEASDLMTPEFLIERIDDFGTTKANNHYAVGWAHAMDTPYQWTNQVASHFGGTRNGTIIHWLPWVVVGAQPLLSEDVWELYDTNKDWSQVHDLAAKMPEKVVEMKRLFELEAPMYNVFPLMGADPANWRTEPP